MFSCYSISFNQARQDYELLARHTNPGVKLQVMPNKALDFSYGDNHFWLGSAVQKTSRTFNSYIGGWVGYGTDHESILKHIHRMNYSVHRELNESSSMSQMIAKLNDLKYLLINAAEGLDTLSQQYSSQYINSIKIDLIRFVEDIDIIKNYQSVSVACAHMRPKTSFEDRVVLSQNQILFNAFALGEISLKDLSQMGDAELIDAIELFNLKEAIEWLDSSISLEDAKGRGIFTALLKKSNPHTLANISLLGLKLKSNSVRESLKDPAIRNLS